MPSFEPNVLRQITAVAIQHGIEPEALLAVAQVESAGRSLEVDGKTPCLLFERHIFYRELTKKIGEAYAQSAANMGLANKTWQPATQYKDQATSQGRLNLLALAKTFDVDCAIRSCSWGVGQTMGFLAEELKFKNAISMLNYMTAGGVPAQVECMVREIENHNLQEKLNAHDWAGFAAVYNGPSYRTNNYDNKMATAWDFWKRTGVPEGSSAQDVHPQGPVTPKPSKHVVIPSVAGGASAGVGASIAAFMAGAEIKWIAVGCFILMMSAITFLIIRSRQQQSQIPQLGTLAGVSIGSPGGVRGHPRGSSS